MAGSGLFSRASFAASPTLDAISGYIKNPNASDASRTWNYGRYAYITIKTTGINNAGLCKGPIATIGDTLLENPNSYSKLKARDGSRDIPSKPLLESVRINNDGSNDISDAALFDIDVSFKCFSKSQFAVYEDAFFKVGSEVILEFGYKGLGLGGGTMNANVYNFGFTMDASGVYSCNMKLTGRNRFAAILSMDQKLTENGTSIIDDEGNEIVATDISSELDNQFKAAFPQYEESGTIQKASTEDFVKDGEAIYKDGYAVANIQTKGGFDATLLVLHIDTDDMFVKYVSFEKLVEVLNKTHNKSGYQWGFGDANGKVIPEFASADPSVLLLDGEMANYGSTSFLGNETKNDLQSGIGFTGNAKTMLISLDFITSTIKRLLETSQNDKDSKGDLAVSNFLRILCETIRDLTGGLYNLVLYNDGFGNDSNVFKIVNNRAEHTAVRAGYTFSTHELGSVLKSVNLSSNMDSDMAAAALVSNRSTKTIPKGSLDNLYSECGGVDDAVVPADANKATLESVKEKKEELGGGFSPQRVQTFKSEMQSYVAVNPKKTDNDKGYRYMIDLSVTTYGAWGTQIGDTFTFDGLPSKYIGHGKYFAVGKMQHSFDGQGGWETEFTGFLKLDVI